MTVVEKTLTANGRRVHIDLMDHSGKTREARVPADVPVRQLKERIVERLENSRFSTDGTPITYDLLHNGRVLGEEETLEDIGVQSGDRVELSPSIQSA